MLCPLQCHLNGVPINEVLQFLAESPSVTTHAIELTDHFNAAHPFIILLQVSSVTNYFHAYSPSIEEYEHKDIPHIHLTAEESPWDPSMNIQKERLVCYIMKVRSILLPQPQGDQYMSAQLSCKYWIIMPLMLWIMSLVPRWSITPVISCCSLLRSRASKCLWYDCLDLEV